MQLVDTMLKLLDGRNSTATSREKLKEEDCFDYLHQLLLYFISYIY